MKKHVFICSSVDVKVKGCQNCNNFLIFLRKKGKRLPSTSRSGGGDKSGKGLRHFSMKVCEKVQQKRTTSYNEVNLFLPKENFCGNLFTSNSSQNSIYFFFQVADELVQEFSDPEKHLSPTDQVSFTVLI